MQITQIQTKEYTVITPERKRIHRVQSNEQKNKNFRTTISIKTQSEASNPKRPQTKAANYKLICTQRHEQSGCGAARDVMHAAGGRGRGRDGHEELYVPIGSSQIPGAR